MELTYQLHDTIPNEKLLEGILKLYSDTFDSSADELLNKMKTKPNLLFNLALNGRKVVGFKIGYEIDEGTFYSWLGGVASHYRNRGIALALMKQQHDYLRRKGYKKVQTKTMNKWRGMLLLNIKYGFDVIETYYDEKGRHKILLEKKL